MRARLALSLAAAVAATAGSATLVDSQQSQPGATPGLESLRQPGAGAGALLRPEAERFVRQGQSQAARQTICRGAPVPAGFIIVDDDRDRTKCGGENPATYNAFNVWVIERIDNRPADSVIEICAATPMPSGWVLVDVYRDNRRCGRPTAHFDVNVKRIRRSR